jgi:hypothetical protein
MEYPERTTNHGQATLSLAAASRVHPFLAQKEELPVVAMFVNGSGQNEHFLERSFHRCFLPSFTSFAATGNSCF